MRMKRRLAMLLIAVMALSACVAVLPERALAATVVNGDYIMDFSQSVPVSWGAEVSDIDFSTQNVSGTGWSWTAPGTLTLTGLDFTTTAVTALKLPANATIVLPAGTENKMTARNVSDNIGARQRLRRQCRQRL